VKTTVIRPTAALATSMALISLSIGAARLPAQASKTNDKTSASAQQEKVETGLTERVHIKGRPLSHWTISQRMVHYHVPAVSLAVINNGALEWARTYGWKQAGPPDLADTDTLFQAASVSKVITALATLRLVQHKDLGLKDDVSERLHSWKLPNSSGDMVTIDELLSHNAAINWPPGESALAPAGPLPTLLQRLKGEPPAQNKPVQVDGTPGSGFRYSDGGYLILGQLISETTGKNFSESVEDLVFKPLHVTHSTFQAFTPDSAPKNIAFGHTADGVVEDGQWRVVGAPEGGLWTTASDLAQAVIAIQRSFRGAKGSFLSPALAKQMLTKQNDRWGLGVQLQGSGDTLAFRHDGSTPGYKAVIFAYAGAYASRGQGAVILTNADRGGELADELLYSIAAAYDWPDFQVVEKEIVAISPEDLKQFVGQYEMAPGAYAAITMENGKLYGQVRGRDKTELLPETATRFFMMEGPTVEFEKDGTGKVTGLVFDRTFDGTFRAQRRP
jgi:CubicO group peptidase (beta-lactamase class C family)